MKALLLVLGLLLAEQLVTLQVRPVSLDADFVAVHGSHNTRWLRAMASFQRAHRCMWCKRHHLTSCMQLQLQLHTRLVSPAEHAAQWAESVQHNMQHLLSVE
jgi:uncharacterized membrane protein